MDDALAAQRNESLEAQQRKARLKAEADYYLAYLAEQRRLNAERDAAVEEMQSSFIAAQQQKQIDQWDREAKARRDLMQHVMEVREGQIAEKRRGVLICSLPLCVRHHLTPLS